MLKVPGTIFGAFRREKNGAWHRSQLRPGYTLRQAQDSAQLRPGYVFLLSVLFVGTIAITAVATLVLLGIASERSGFALSKSTQARWNARTCVERALRLLRDSNSYAGNVTFTLVDGTCTLRTIGGSGNANRRICAEGRAGNAVRRLELDVEELLPIGEIRTWREVASFTLC